MKKQNPIPLKNLVQEKNKWIIVSAILGLALMNTGLSEINSVISTPFFFDSIGTAICAALFGYLPGILTAIFTHLFFEVFHGFAGSYYPFVVCNIATAVIVAAMVKKTQLSSLLYIALCVIYVALANAILGTVVATFVFGGVTGHASDYLVNGLLLAGQGLIQASFWARIPANLIDKGIAVFAAHGILRLVKKDVSP